MSASTENSQKNKTPILPPLFVTLAFLILCAYFVLILISIATESRSTDTSEEVNGDSSQTESSLEIREAPEIEGYSSPQSEPITRLQDGEIYYLAYGSSTCPPVIDEAHYSDENTIRLTPATYEGMCTMDMAPIAQLISRTDGEPIGENTEIVIEGVSLERQTLSSQPSFEGRGEKLSPEDLEWRGTGMRINIHPYPINTDKNGE